ncbi:MAG: hypothetical protein ACOYMB_04395 [Patescibacteria group bacterium]
MKKIKLLLLFIGLIVLTTGVSAQYKMGLMYNPQGKMLLNETNKGFSLVNPLYAVLTYEKGKNSVSPMFCLNDNSVGVFASHNFNKTNVYLVGAKSTQNQDLYLGLGYGINVPTFSLFVEFGSLTNKWEPQIYVGMSIPVMFNL